MSFWPFLDDTPNKQEEQIQIIKQDPYSALAEHLGLRLVVPEINVYEDEKGQRFIKTKYGFVLCKTEEEILKTKKR